MLVPGVEKAGVVAKRRLRGLKISTKVTLGTCFKNTPLFYKSASVKMQDTSNHTETALMAWDFETDPEFQQQLDWVKQFVEEELIPLEPIMADFTEKQWNMIIKGIKLKRLIMAWITRGFAKLKGFQEQFMS